MITEEKPIPKSRLRNQKYRKKKALLKVLEKLHDARKNKSTQAPQENPIT